MRCLMKKTCSSQSAEAAHRSLSCAAKLGGMFVALAGGGLEVRRWILIWAQALLTSAGGMWCFTMLLMALRCCEAGVLLEEP